MNEPIPMWIFTLIFISGVSSFRWENCGPSTNPIKLKDLSVKQTKTVLYVTMNSKVAENLTAPIQGELQVKKFIPFLNVYVDIPCLDNIGSCKYDDVCQLSSYKNESCPAYFNENNLPCKCPIQKNNYAAKEFPIKLDSLPQEILHGTYKLNIKLFKYNEQLLCLDIKITL